MPAFPNKKTDPNRFSYTLDDLKLLADKGGPGSGPRPGSGSQRASKDELKSLTAGTVSKLDELAKIDPSAAKALKDWTGDSSKHAAMKQYQKDGTIPQKWEHDKDNIINSVKVLEDRVKDLPAVVGQITRHIDLPVNHNLKVGSTFETSSFESYGRVLTDAFETKNTTMMIKDNKSGKLVGALSVYPKEQEVLIPKGTKYKVVDVIKGKKRQRIMLEEV